MKLTNFRSTDYKSIENSGEVTVDQVTCLVGKNEAGKTANFETLFKLSPVAEADGNFRIEDYPRRKMNAYKRVHDANPATAITAKFLLNDDEIKQLSEQFGDKIVTSKEINFEKKYDNKVYIHVNVDEITFIKNLIKKHAIAGDLLTALESQKTVKDLLAEANNKVQEFAPAKKIIEALSGFDKGLYQKVIDFIHANFLPKFFYFDDYSILPGKISLTKLKAFRDSGTAQDDDEKQSFRTALALINFVGSTIEEFLVRDNYERLKASLEAASNAITDQVFEYWTQNKELEVEFDLDPVFEGNSQVRDTILQIRIRNKKHRVTVPFDKRSKGFVWFFSFLVAFSAYKNQGNKIILLLDEPGLNLHAKAQFDLLRFIDQELAPYHQVLYTTHSPFMIPPAKLERVRTVHDRDNLGTIISNDPLSDDPDTVFPLQAALGYDLAQTLFLGPNTLIVEGPGDLIYFNVATAILQKEGKIGLSSKWVVVPVGGADKIPTFVSLLGANQLNVAVAVDISQKDKQRIDNLIQNHFLEKSNLVTIGDIIGAKNADIEDLFSIEGYLLLVNAAYEKELSGKPIKSADISVGDPRVIKKLEEHFKKQGITNGEFNHYRPAHILLNDPTLAQKVFDKAAKENFEALFKKVNPMIKDGASVKTVQIPSKI